MGTAVHSLWHERLLQPAPRTLAQRLVGVAAGSSLLYLAWTGATGFLDQWPDATGIGRIVQTSSELVYAVGAVLCVVTTVRARRWARVARRAWITGATLAGGLAPVVWGGAPIWLSLVTGGASLGLALGLLWMLRRGFPPGESTV